jgi:hypothetical protein
MYEHNSRTESRDLVMMKDRTRQNRICLGERLARSFLPDSRAAATIASYFTGKPERNEGDPTTERIIF